MALSSLPSLAHGDDAMQLVAPKDAVTGGEAETHQQLRGGAAVNSDHQEPSS